MFVRILGHLTAVQGSGLLYCHGRGGEGTCPLPILMDPNIIENPTDDDSHCCRYLKGGCILVGFRLALLSLICAWGDVYGVQLPHCDGRAGCVSLILMKDPSPRLMAEHLLYNATFPEGTGGYREDEDNQAAKARAKDLGCGSDKVTNR
jgi:hypothetical protein